MITRSWKVYGAEGHRQRESFNNSYRWDFSEGNDVRIIEVDNADNTGTNDYSIIRITRNTAGECERELDGQITDGVFENSRTGRIEEIFLCGGNEMTNDLKILKAILMLRQWGNKYQTKEEQIAEQHRWLKDDPTYAERLDEWIDSLREDLALTPEERRAKEEREFEESIIREEEWDLREQSMYRERERDEWDDLWADRARSVGATWF